MRREVSPRTFENAFFSLAIANVDGSYATVQFVNLVPIGLDAFPTGLPGVTGEQIFRRGVTLAVGAFTIQ